MVKDKQGESISDQTDNKLAEILPDPVHVWQEQLHTSCAIVMYSNHCMYSLIVMYKMNQRLYLEYLREREII